MIPALLTAGLLFVASPSPSAQPVRTTDGSISFFGGDYTIPADEVRDGNVTVYGGDGDIEGTVSHDLVVFGGDVTVNGSVGHDVVIFGGEVHLGARADVGHDVTVLGGSLDRDPGAQVGHNVTEGGFNVGALTRALPPLPPLARLDTPLRLGLSAAIVLLALLLQLLFPRQIALARDALDERPFASLGLGCLTAVAGVLLAALLALTVILVLATAALTLALVAGCLLGLAALIALVGERLLGSLHVHVPAIPTVLIGGVLVAALVNVPVVGVVFGVLIASMALGAAVLTRFGTRPHPPAPPRAAAPPEATR
jgi:hypothetical protein